VGHVSSYDGGVHGGLYRGNDGDNESVSSETEDVNRIEDMECMGGDCESGERVFALSRGQVKGVMNLTERRDVGTNRSRKSSNEDPMLLFPYDDGGGDHDADVNQNESRGRGIGRRGNDMAKEKNLVGKALTLSVQWDVVRSAENMLTVRRCRNRVAEGICSKETKIGSRVIRHAEVMQHDLWYNHFESSRDVL
jgi:hypothetical protein